MNSNKAPLTDAITTAVARLVDDAQTGARALDDNHTCNVYFATNH
jgi:hypothetical protein